MGKKKITLQQKYLLGEYKKPPETFLGKWRSIEFECIFNDTEAMLEFEEYCVRSKYRDLITFKNDHSIKDNDGSETGLGKEIVLTYRSGNERFVKRTLKELNKHAYVNHSCGTHVHFDMRGFTADQVERFGDRLAHCVPVLRLILPKSRRDNEYCEKIINGMDEWDHDRYAFVNMLAYDDHQTIEVRGHSGTLNAEKILNWIKICEVIMSQGKVAGKKYVSDTELFIKHYKFDKKLKTYINKRYEQLNPTN